MIGYNPSHLNTNETLLEAFHRVEAYLKANPQYQVYQSSATYQEGTQEYALNTIVVPEGSTVGKGDVVLFSNVYYAVITAVSETTFSIQTATSFRGATGATGPQGPKGDTGATGAIALEYGDTHTEQYEGDIANEPIYLNLSGFNRTPVVNDIFLLVFNVTESGKTYIAPFTVLRVDATQAYVSLNGANPLLITGPTGAKGESGNATYLYDGMLGAGVIDVQISQITIPTGRTLQVNDILISSNPSTLGAMAQVAGIVNGVATVDFIGRIQGGSGVSNYNNLDNIPVINQDLTANGFTPVANTYYRHTGATTDTFTQGVIYLYDTAYHKLGESGGGGGTTLNKYTVDIAQSASATTRTLLFRIVQNAKGNIQIQDSGFPLTFAYWSEKVELMGLKLSSTFVAHGYSIKKDGTMSYSAHAICNTGETLTITTAKNAPELRIIYYNDTEIT